MNTYKEELRGIALTCAILMAGCGGTGGPEPRPAVPPPGPRFLESGQPIAPPQDREDYRNCDPVPTPIDPVGVPKLVASYRPGLADTDTKVVIHFVSQENFFVRGKDKVEYPYSLGAYELIVEYVKDDTKWKPKDPVLRSPGNGNDRLLDKKEMEIDDTANEVRIGFQEKKIAGKQHRHVTGFRVEARDNLVTIPIYPRRKP